MILIAISFSAYLLWAACGFQGMPARAKTAVHVMLPSLWAAALSLSLLHV